MHFVVEYQEWIQDPKDETISSDIFKENFETIVESDLEALEKIKDDDYKKECRLLNNLIDNIRELFYTSNKIKIPHGLRKHFWDNQIEGNLKNMISKTTKNKCERKGFTYPQKDRDLRLKLHNYCDERDKRLNDLKGKENNEDNCYDFMVWVNQNKDSINKDYRNHMSGVKRRAGFFKISDTCDLYKFDDLFALPECSSKIFRKDEVLKTPQEILEKNTGSDQNTVDEKKDLKDKGAKDTEKGKSKEKEKKPSSLPEEILGVGRKDTESFFLSKPPDIEEAVREYITTDCAGDDCIVLDCTDGGCTHNEGRNEEPENESEPNSIASSSTNKDDSLQSEKRRKEEDRKEDSTQKECYSEECVEENIKKNEPEQPSKTERSPPYKSQDDSNGPGKGHPKFQTNNSKGRQRGKHGRTPSLGEGNRGRKGKGDKESPKKRNGRGNGDGTREKNESKGRSGRARSGDATGKKRKRKLPVLKSPPHSKGDDGSTSDDKGQIQETDINDPDEYEIDIDSYEDVHGTIELIENDDGKNSIFGITFPNFLDYSDFDLSDFNLSDFSLSNIPYPTIRLPFFPRSPRIYKGLYDGIRRIGPSPTHININTYKDVDTARDIINKLQDKAGSDNNYSSDGRNGRKGNVLECEKRKKTHRGGRNGDRTNHAPYETPRSNPSILQNGFSDRGTSHRGTPGKSEGGSGREKDDTNGKYYKGKQKEDSEGSYSENTVKHSDENGCETNNFNQGDVNKKTCKELQVDDNCEQKEKEVFKGRKDSSQEDQDRDLGNTISVLVSSQDAGRVSSFSSRVSEDDKSNLLKSVNNSPGSDIPNEEDFRRSNKSSESNNFTLAGNNEQSKYNGLGEDHEQAVVADGSDPSIIIVPYHTEEEVAVTYSGPTCKGVIYERGNPPCTDDSKSNDIMSHQGNVSHGVSILGNEIEPIKTVDAKGQHQSLDSNYELMVSRVLSMNSVEHPKPLFQGTLMAAQQYSSHSQTLGDNRGLGQTNSESGQQQGNGPTSAASTREVSTSEVSASEVSASVGVISADGISEGGISAGGISAGGISEGGTSTGRARRSTKDPYPKELSITTPKGINGGTLITNKRHQSSLFFDFSSLTKNISVSLAIFGVIFLFIFSNRHSSLGMFNKKKKKRRRKYVLIKEDNMNAGMFERNEDIDEEENERRTIYEEEHEDDENDDKVDEDDSDYNELNKSGVILLYEKEEDDVYKIEDQLVCVDSEKIEKDKSKYINVEHTSDEQAYDYNNMYDDKYINLEHTSDEYTYDYYNIHDDEAIKSVDVERIIKEKKERWKWKTIIEIQMAVIEEIHDEKWEMNKEDFLFICINEFVNDKDRKCLYNTDDDFNSTTFIIKRQRFLWNRWMERQTYILDKWKEEESFVYLKNDWKREEDEYMKKIYKELLLSLRGDTYNMSQRQKIIWKRWIAKHPYRIREKTIDEWFDKLFEEINKNGIINDDVIDILLNDYKENVEYIYDMSEKRKKLKLILWIQIYMCVLDEAEKDKCIEKKETYVDMFIENIKDKVYIIDVVEDIKKDIHTLPINTFSCKWKKGKWFEELKSDWKEEENKRLNGDLLKNNKDIYKEMMEKSTTYIENNILEKLWEDINFKWIDEDNENDWLKVTENNSKDENNIIYINKKRNKNNNTNTNIYINKNIKKEENKMKCYEEKHMFGNMSFQGHKEDYHEHNFLEVQKDDDTNNIFNEKFKVEDINTKNKDVITKNKDVITKKKDIITRSDKIHIVLNQHNNEWIQVIKIHLHLIDECKKEEWEKNKYDFLEICIQEYIKNENKDNNNSRRKKNILEDEIFSMNKNIMWDTFIEAHRYILEKWKREEWFCNLKNEWNVEALNYLNSSENKNDEKGISMIEKEKNIFRKWINKHTEELKDCYNEDEKNPFLEEAIKKKKKNYKLIAWIQIHMMILERLKEDECLANKRLFIDVCIELIKKGHLCKNNVVIIEMLNKLKSDMYNSFLYLLPQENDDKKKEEWYKQLNKYWMYKESTYFNFLGQKDNDETIHDIIKESMISVYDNMFIKNYDDQKFQWIDEDNEKDWLKCANVKKEEIFSHNICEYKLLKDIKRDVPNETSFLLSNNKTIVEKQQDDVIDISKSELPMCNKIMIENKMSILRDIYKTKEILTFYSEEM
ncbi:surface-associated interspersed protein 1.2 (SURFIN 1.2) [Plasmodium reichenowi]|uniref:Surface-associated interspersed protein 1.2 (SURFIN 1.2) n=1 Tax=Plasmodium reichenowi TaxID=5854 RepID=A0A060RRP6_PLARE|nr:surface-associated interspersed protein 1.2 (SURFIN 1.2) [Plasmodium reichenowi]